MQLKTSYFNRTLFRKNLSRYWPLWAMAGFFGAIFPLAMLTNMAWGMDTILPVEMTEIYYNVVAYGLPTISLIYAILCAMAVWNYLYNARSVGTMHTLPIRREGLFLTNFLSGMAMMLIPYVITGVCCVVVTLICGCFDFTGLGMTVLAVLGESFFYFSSATLVAFVTGNIFALPALYFILHFLAPGLDLLISLLARGFLFGFEREYTGAVEWLSPTIYLSKKVGIGREYIEVERVSEFGEKWMESELVAVWLKQPGLIAVYAAVGLVLLGVAWLLYRARRSESAGDVVAVEWMKPVFRYGVSVCGALAGGLLLYALLWDPFRNSQMYDLLPLLVCMAVAGAISYYAASMLLTKSLRVFRGSWKGLGLVTLSVVIICGVMRFDLLGVEKRIPKVEDVERVYLYTANNTYDFYPENGEDAARIEELRTIHKLIVNDQNYVQSAERLTYTIEERTDVTWTQFRVEYYLKNGLTVQRSYYIPVTRERLQNATFYDHYLDTLINSRDMKVRRLYLHDARLQPESAHLYFERMVDGRDHSLSLSDREAQALLDAVGRDMLAGNWGEYHWFDRDSGNDYAMDLSFSLGGEDEEGNHLWEHIGIVVTPDMTETVGVLLALDLADESQLVTRRELRPEDYEDNMIYYDEYGAKFNTPYPTEVAVYSYE